MKIYLLDFNINITNAWNALFKDNPNVVISNDDFGNFLNSHKDVECIVSPGNSYGMMTGGYDGAITKYFGPKLMQKVQELINTRYAGCQPVASAFIMQIPDNSLKLIHCPTMAMPSIIKDPKIVYDCTLATLKVAKDNKIGVIVLPAFGGLTGAVDPKELAKNMFNAIQDVEKI